MTEQMTERKMNHHNEPKPGGPLRAYRAAIYSMQGFRAAWVYESSFRQELTLLAVLLPVSLWIAQNGTQWIAMIATAMLVLLTELLNSAVEAAVDRHGEETHDLSGRAKDLGSAAVFVSMLIFGLVWGAVLINRYVIDFL